MESGRVFRVEDGVIAIVWSRGKFSAVWITAFLQSFLGVGEGFLVWRRALLRLYLYEVNPFRAENIYPTLTRSSLSSNTWNQSEGFPVCVSPSAAFVVVFLSFLSFLFLFLLFSLIFYFLSLFFSLICIFSYFLFLSILFSLNFRFSHFSFLLFLFSRTLLFSDFYFISLFVFLLLFFFFSCSFLFFSFSFRFVSFFFFLLSLLFSPHRYLPTYAAAASSVAAAAAPSGGSGEGAVGIEEELEARMSGGTSKPGPHPGSTSALEGTAHSRGVAGLMDSAPDIAKVRYGQVG